MQVEISSYLPKCVFDTLAGSGNRSIAALLQAEVLGVGVRPLNRNKYTVPGFPMAKTPGLPIRIARLTTSP